MPNRLAGETSPYLLQHKDNPVDWFPWGEEALGRARDSDRPLLVSIGYAACHWCHVMAHESFEDQDIAALMNELFVCVKVDREERPDVDAICMEACVAMNGHGGWPLNVFLTPGQQPFFAGTYFPPQPRQGMPSWQQLLHGVDQAWRERREEILEQGARLAGAIAGAAGAEPDLSRPGGTEPDPQDTNVSDPTQVPNPQPGGLPPSAVETAIAALRQMFDARNAGWGGAAAGARGGPKFPPHSTLEFLLAAGEREMALGTLHAMARGGICDQVGGGFARYAVDATWTVPHFEKMLYDNALLARAYLHGWQVSGDERLREVCEQTLDFALRELQGPEGGFCSSLDADSEGVEGKFYVWSIEELRDVLGADADAAIAYFGATEQGNFEGNANVLEARGPTPAHLPQIRAKLLDARARRIRPGLDDKRLAAWNALMIAALADAGAALDSAEYTNAAVRAADFVLTEMRAPDGRLLRTWKDGRAHIAGYLEDHAYMLQALLVLYEATFDERHYEAATAIADTLLEHFADPERGGFFTTAKDATPLVARIKDLQDTPTPSGNSAAALGLLRLARLSSDDRYERAATVTLERGATSAAWDPQGFGHLLQAIDFQFAPPREVAIVYPSQRVDLPDTTHPIAREIRGRFRPHEVLAGGPEDQPTAVPLLAHRPAVDGRETAYVCERFACQAPVADAAALRALLR